MRNLRHLLSRFGITSSRERLRRGPRTSSAKNRRALLSESLEKRELLAGDILFAHNYLNPADVDDNMQITASDALRVINALSRSEGGGIEVTDAGQTDGYMDVNGDGWVTASDALSVINAVSRGEAASAGVKLFLNLRDENDVALTTDSTRSATVNTDDVFFLEVSYSDERTFGADIGAFQVVTDILVDQADVLTPIVTDTDEINIESSLRSATSGSATFSLSDPVAGQPATVVVDLNGLSDLDQAIKDAVVSLGGYDPDTIVVTSLQGEPLGRFPGQVSPTPTNDSNFQFRIRYNDFDLANQDLPDLQVTFDMDVTVRSEVISTSPLDENGDIRGSAVGLNLDTRSRTAPSSSPFGRDIYNSLTLGTYVADDGNGGSLFDNFLAVGPLSGGGIEQAVPGFEEPFDTFSIPLRVSSAVQDLGFSLGLAGGGDDFLVYGETGDEAILTDNQIEFDPVLSIVTLNVVDPNGNTLMAANGDIDTNEDVTDTIDLSTLITGTPDSIAISTNGTLGTASLSGTTLSYVPNADANGADSVVYTVTAGTETATGTITVTITPVNDAPVAVADSRSAFQDTTTTIAASELLANDTDIDNSAAELSVTSVATTTTGATVVLNGTDIAYTPVAGFTGNDTFSYTISDGDLTATATVTVTVSTSTTAPVAGSGSLPVTEDIAATIDLSGLVTGGDADSFTATDGTLGTVSIVDDILTYTPGANLFGADSFVYTATNAAGSSQGTVTVTITAVNDPPTAGDDSVSVVENGTLSITAASLFANDSVGAANETGDVLSITSISATTATGSSATLSTDGSTIAYVAGGIGTDSFTYTLSDGNGGTTTGTVNVTITDDGIVTPIAGDGTITAEQNNAGSVDLATLLSGGSPDSITITSQGANGTATLSGTLLTFTPNAGFTGTNSVEYTATNSAGSDTGTIAVTITEPVPVNNPVIPGDVTVSATEDTAVTFTAATLIANSSPGTDEASQTLTVSNPRSASAGGTVQLVAGDVLYTPTADFSGTETFVVTVTDNGTPADSDNVTVTVNVAGVNDAPVASNDTASALTGQTVTIDVLANDSAGPTGEDQSLTVVTATSSDGTVTINNDGTLSFIAASTFTGDATINYTIEDSDGAQDSATVTVTVTDFVPVTLSGSVFIDNVESPSNPVRDGIQNGDDQGIGGIEVRLLSSTGVTVASVITAIDGSYSFTDVAPGNYTVVYAVPDTIRTIGSTSAAVVVDPNSSTTPSIPSLSVAGTQNTGLETITILSSSYLRRNGSVAGMSNGGREGGSVSFDASGNQELFIAGEGFEDVIFGEVVMSSVGDSAVLVIVREGATAPEVATIDSEFFVQSSGGKSMQFFGGIEDFDFSSVDGELGSVDLARYQAAVDRALSEL